MHKRIRNLVFLMLLVPVVIWAADPQTGIWKLNVAKSKFASDTPAPRAETVKIREQGSGINEVSDGVNAEGKPTHFEFTAQYDGRDYPIIGSPSADTVVLRRINSLTLETIRKKGRKVLAIEMTVISEDGKTRTNTFQGKNLKGQARTWTVVFEKQ